MFERAHHLRIEKLLLALDASLLARAECYFGGGTAIALLLGEYRESLDVDFLCSSTEGYRALRETVFTHGFAGLTRSPLRALRDLRTDQYGIRTFVEVDGVAIKFEIVREARLELTGESVQGFSVPVLTRIDLFAEKLLANTDRALDRSSHSRDVIDLGMMVHHWGAIPAEAWNKARTAYGDAVVRSLEAARSLMNEPAWRTKCFEAMQMAPQAGALAYQALTTIVGK